MRKMTIAEMREKELIRFSKNYGIEYNESKRLINSFYRLCGLEETLLIRANDERLYNRPYTKELEQKEQRWIDRLQKNLDSYNLKMVWFGYLPTICEKGTTREALSRYFYQ